MKNSSIDDEKIKIQTTRYDAFSRSIQSACSQTISSEIPLTQFFVAGAAFGQALLACFVKKFEAPGAPTSSETFNRNVGIQRYACFLLQGQDKSRNRHVGLKKKKCFLFFYAFPTL